MPIHCTDLSMSEDKGGWNRLNPHASVSDVVHCEEKAGRTIDCKDVSSI